MKGYPPAKDFLFREKILTSRFAKTLCEISINVKMSSFFQHSNHPHLCFFSNLIVQKFRSRIFWTELTEKRTRPPRALTLSKRQLSERNIGKCFSIIWNLWLRLLSTEIDCLETVKYYSCCLKTLLLSFLCNYDIRWESVKSINIIKLWQVFCFHC